MAAFKRIEEIEAWQAARRLNQGIWQLINSGSFLRDFSLIDQLEMIRAEVSHKAGGLIRFLKPS